MVPTCNCWQGLWIVLSIMSRLQFSLKKTNKQKIVGLRISSQKTPLHVSSMFMWLFCSYFCFLPQICYGILWKYCSEAFLWIYFIIMCMLLWNWNYLVQISLYSSSTSYYYYINAELRADQRPDTSLVAQTESSCDCFGSFQLKGINVCDYICVSILYDTFIYNL